MDLNTYQLKAAETAIYRDKIDAMVEAAKDMSYFPSWGLAGPLRQLYAGMGLMEEILELTEHIDGGPTVEGVTAEMGDVMWYLAMLADEIELTLQNCFKLGKAPPARIPVSRLLVLLLLRARPIPGTLKRMIRDNGGELDDRQKKILAISIGSAVRTVMGLSDALAVGFETVLSTNVEKLAGRQQRDLLTGSGDNR